MVAKAGAQRYMSDTYGYSCYNYFDNINVSSTVGGTTTNSSTANVYAPGFLPDPDVSANNTSVVVSSAAINNLTLSATGRCLTSKYQATPKSVYVNNINGADAATYAPLNSNDWEWSFLFKSNLASGTYPSSAPQNAAITSSTANSWRYWLHATTSTISSSTQGFYVTQTSDGYLRVYVQNGSGTTAQLIQSNAALPNGVTYCIKIQRLTGGYWKMYIDPYTASVTQAKTLQTSNTNSDNQTISLTYTNSVLEAENKSGSDGAFQFDEMHMYTRYASFTGIASTANGVTPSPLYAGEGTVILYGEQIQMRGNYELGGQIYFGKNDTGYPEGNLNGTATLYKTSSSTFSTSTGTAITTLSLSGGGIGGTSSAAGASLSDTYVSAGNTDGTLTTTGYYFITTTVNASIASYNITGVSMAFTGNVQVYDNAKNNSPIVNTSSAGTTTSNIYFAGVYDWNGSTSVNTQTAANWTPNGVPGATDYARIGYIDYSSPYNQPTVSTTSTIYNIIIGPYRNPKITIAAGKTLTIAAGFAVNTATTASISGPGTLILTGTSTVNGTASFTINPTGVLSLANNSSTLTVNGSATFTLASDTTGTATVTAIPSGGTAAINGIVTVQRFLQGSPTYDNVKKRWLARSYRILSSAVNEGADVNGNYPYSLNYLGAKTIITDCVSTYSSTPGNPSLYLYSDKYTPSNASFTSGNFIGVTNISSTIASGTISTTDATNSTGKIYVGGGFLMYFRGDKVIHITGSPSKTSYPYVSPEGVVFSATGYLNQGTYSVKSWTGDAGLMFNTSNYPNNSSIQGFNMVGNPYPSSIDWSLFSNTDPSAPIYGYHVDPTVYIFNPRTNNYDTYNAGSNQHTGSATNIIPSGQGFFVRATDLSPTLTFRESAKITSQVTSSNLLMGVPAGQNVTSQFLRLKLSADSLNDNDIVIGFKSTATTKYNGFEDSKFLSGSGAIVSLSSFSTDSIPVQLSINFLPLPKQTQQIIRLNTKTTLSGTLTLQRTELSALPPIYEVWLMDNYKKDSLDLRNNATYTFNADQADTASFGKNRFQVIIRQNQALGVHLLDFTAVKASGGAQIAWKTENEQNYTNFTVERSTDNGVTFDVLGGSLSNSQGIYSFLDKNPANTVDRYRLKIEDLNGIITYSKVIALTYGAAANAIASSNINVYPNPASGVLNLSIKTNSNSPTILSGLQNINKNPVLGNPQSGQSPSYAIKIISISGTVVKTANSSQTDWQDNVSTLLPGTYIIQVINNNDKTLVGKTTFVKI